MNLRVCYYILNTKSQHQNILVNQLMCKSIKDLQSIGKSLNITGVFTYNKQGLAVEIVKLHGCKP